MDSSQKNLLAILIIVVIVLILALGGLTAYVIFDSANAPDRPTPQQTTTGTSQAAGDPVWNRIQAAGKVVVGVSADYPPFAFVANDFSLQGYDLALIEEMSNRLNLPFEIKNMAFDGLIDALELGQIDMAVAAISVTPERDQYIDFSNVYFVGEGAALALQESQAGINQWEDLIPYRVGVQKGSVYENLLLTTLIAPGQMPAQSLIQFESADQLLQALSGANRSVDLALMDYQAAGEAAKDGTLKIVGQNLSPQRFAAAIPQDAMQLQARINSVLAEMQADGTLPALAKQYLNIQNPAPMPTPMPTAPPAPPQPCLDGMAFVQDLTYPDSNMLQPVKVQPGTIIQKGWRIRNIGTCTWTGSYRLAFAGSNPANAGLGGSPVLIQGVVQPNGVYDIYINLVAPPWPGRYQSFWTMQNATGEQFGQRIWAGFEVPAPVGPTQTPIPPAPQIFAFAVDRREVYQGECVALDWQYLAQDLVMARLFRDEMVLLTDLPFIGSYTDCPSQIGSVQYRLVVDTRTGGSARAAQEVQVTMPLLPTPVPRPIIDYFYISQDAITIGECVSLSWSYTGLDLNSTAILMNGNTIQGNPPPSGSITDCPRVAGMVEYMLQVTSNSSGNIQQSVYVSVMQPVYPTQFPPIDPPGPVYPTELPPIDPPGPVDPNDNALIDPRGLTD